jgi:hypothetical protein
MDAARFTPWGPSLRWGDGLPTLTKLQHPKRTKL